MEIDNIGSFHEIVKFHEGEKYDVTSVTLQFMFISQNYPSW